MGKALLAIIGEFKPEKETHTLLNQAMDWLKEHHDFEYEWVNTREIKNKKDSILNKYCGIWSAPGSPFESFEGVLYAIKYARENNIPFIGTCAGFQNTVLEFARNEIGYKDAQHEEYDEESTALFINKLACSLKGQSMDIKIVEDSKAFHTYNQKVTTEDYYCSFGINPEFREPLFSSSLSISGVDQDGEVRIIEIRENTFFVATLFVPQTRATKEKPHPIIKRFVEEAIEYNKDWQLNCN